MLPSPGAAAAAGFGAASLTLGSIWNSKSVLLQEGHFYLEGSIFYFRAGFFSFISK